jgi:SAM-dependent methyltransferase
MAGKLKKNVKTFENDVKKNKGYEYNTNEAYSSFVANERLNKAIFKYLIPEYRTMVDIGCGDGAATDIIRKKCKNLKIVALDPAKEAIRLAQKKYPHIKFFASSILDEKSARSRAGKYDVALYRGVLHHVSDPVLAIKNGLKMSDNLIIIEPNGNNPILKQLERKSKYHIEHEEKSFSTEELKGFCVNAGGEILKKEYIGFIPFFFPEIPARIIHFFQPLLELIPFVIYFFTGQIVLICKKSKGTGAGK